MSAYDTDERLENFDDDRPDSDDTEDLSAPIAAHERPKLTSEPVFATLLRQAIDPDDVVLRDYADHVVPNLSLRLGHVTAKGGNFAEQKLADGLSAAEVARYGADQSMRAHIINGLLPTARVARTLHAWGEPRLLHSFTERGYRLFCAGYTMHDWLKLPDVEAQLEALGLTHASANAARHLPQIEAIIGQWCRELGMEAFLAPIGGLDAMLHDVISIASNTQLRWGTMLNFGALPRLAATGPERTLATDLATLADYVAYLGRSPVMICEPRVQKRLAMLSTSVRLTYHHLADVRGVLTNIINNAAVDACTIPGMREPLLFAPTGVVYLERRDAPPLPNVAAIADAAVTLVRDVGGSELVRAYTGFGRDGKGLKFADYYNMFFSPAELTRLVAHAAAAKIRKEGAAAKRYDGLVARGYIDAATAEQLPALLEVERLAETCALVSKIADAAAPDLDGEGMLIDALGLSGERPLHRTISSDSRNGGVPYGWYYLAGLYRRRTPGLDPQQWNARIDELVETVAARLPSQGPANTSGWAELRRYIAEHLTLREQTPADPAVRGAVELERYATARRSRGGDKICSLCTSPYSVSDQQDAASLFAPMVYTNKQPLHGSRAIRGICAVCSAEMMLRQMLMKRGAERGGDFEKRRLRYLFFYPSYFFTAETLRVVGLYAEHLKTVRFADLRAALTPETGMAALQIDDLAVFQRMEALLLNTAEIAPGEDRWFRQHTSTRHPATFAFVGIPPQGKDAKDAEAWVQPALLALITPLLIDVKVVASESMLPVLNEAADMDETVLFDGVHAAFASVLGATRLNLDRVGPALQRLLAAYIVHIEGNAGTGARGYDYRWNQLPAVARDLATSPLYAFHYLAKGARESEGMNSFKAEQFVDLTMRYLQKGHQMNHPLELTRLYRTFYRTKRRNANARLRPLAIAAEVILTADRTLFADDDALVAAVQGRIQSFIDDVDGDKTTGDIPKWIPRDERIAAIETFSTYMVHTIFRSVFQGNRAAFAGKQFNLLKNACETIYLAEERAYWANRAQTDQTDETVSEAMTSTEEGSHA